MLRLNGYSPYVGLVILTVFSKYSTGLFVLPDCTTNLCVFKRKVAERVIEKLEQRTGTKRNSNPGNTNFRNSNPRDTTPRNFNLRNSKEQRIKKQLNFREKHDKHQSAIPEIIIRLDYYRKMLLSTISRHQRNSHPNYYFREQKMDDDMLPEFY